MITEEVQQAVTGWFAGRLPGGWSVEPPRVTVDREEITVVLGIEDVDLGDAGESEVTEVAMAEARAGRARGFREDTREERMRIAREAQHRYERTVSWGLRVGDHEELWTHVAAPVMTRLRQPQRQVLDTLVESGVARSRADALAWCVRLVGQHEGDWLAELREAMTTVDDVRKKGPAA
jgi:hypothetical protein